MQRQPQQRVNEHAATIEAIENALTFLEALGYTQGGDIHDDLALALIRLKGWTEVQS